MSAANDENKGLLYSLLASLKTLNSDDMFSRNENGEPVKSNKYSPTGYLSNLKHVPMSKCTKVKVYTNSDNTENTEGWVTEEDRGEIDPNAIVKEGFVDPSDYFNGGTPEDFGKQGASFSKGMTAQAKSMQKQTHQTAKDAVEKSQQMIDKGKDQAKKGAQESAAASKKQQDDMQKMTNDAASKSKAKNVKNQLKKAVKTYLERNKKTSILTLLTRLINSSYECGDQQTIRISDKCIDAIYANQPTEDIKSKDEHMPHLCPGQKFPDISIKNMFDTMSAKVRTNRDNTDQLDAAALLASTLPPKQVCTRTREFVCGPSGSGYFMNCGMKWVKKSVSGKDYSSAISALDKYREAVATEIVRYTDVGFYGTCEPTTESFTNITSIKELNSTNRYQITAYLYIFSIIILLCYLVYRCF